MPRTPGLHHLAQTFFTGVVPLIAKQRHPRLGCDANVYFIHCCQLRAKGVEFRIGFLASRGRLLGKEYSWKNGKPKWKMSHLQSNTLGEKRDSLFELRFFLDNWRIDLFSKVTSVYFVTVPSP